MTEHKESISDLKKLVSNLKKDKLELIEEVEKNESQIYELKKKFPGECTYGCNKYNKSVDEIVTAGNKHREKVLALKDIAEEQKEKIYVLRKQKSQLENQVDKLKDDLEMEKQYVYTIQKDFSKKNSKTKDDLKASEESQKALAKENSDYLEILQSLKKKYEDLESLIEKKEQAMKVKEEEYVNISKKLDFIKPKLESSLRENRSLHERVDILENEKSVISSKAIEELQEKTNELEHAYKDKQLVFIKNKDLEDEILQQEKQIKILNEISVKARSKSFHDSASSLADELDSANRVTNDKKTELEIKLGDMKQKLNAQKGVLSSTLFQLKENEWSEKKECNCKKKSECNEILATDILQKETHTVEFGRRENGEEI